MKRLLLQSVPYTYLVLYPAIEDSVNLCLAVPKGDVWKVVAVLGIMSLPLIPKMPVGHLATKRQILLIGHSLMDVG